MIFAITTSQGSKYPRISIITKAARETQVGGTQQVYSTQDLPGSHDFHPYFLPLLDDAVNWSNLLRYTKQREKDR